MTPEDIVNLITQKKWLALAPFLIGIVVRLLKSDTKIPITIPPAFRSWFAIFLGVLAGVIEKALQDGTTTWTSALIHGLAVAAVAMVSHTLFIDSLRGGKELTIPWLTLPGVPPGPGKPPSIPAPPLPAEPSGSLPSLAWKDEDEEPPDTLKE